MTGSISKQHVEESISVAHIYAIAGKAGLVVAHDNHDYGIDGMFKTVITLNEQTFIDGINLEFQLKASVNIRHPRDKDYVSYDMPVDAYKRLWARNNLDYSKPAILLVCELATDSQHWVDSATEALTLKKCCYFHKFLKMNQTTNSSTETVYLMKSNLLTPTSLQALLREVKEEIYTL